MEYFNLGKMDEQTAKTEIATILRMLCKVNSAMLFVAISK